MTETPASSYVSFLPPVIWRDDPAAPALSLGTFLQAFETILSRTDPDHPVEHTGPDGHVHHHRSISDVIAGITDLFDPWRAPPTFLPWLASLVGVEYPQVSTDDLWSEYQQRRALVDIALIHRHRGLRDGLQALLELQRLVALRPRIVVDDRAAILTVATRPGRCGTPTAIWTGQPVFTDVNSQGIRELYEPGLVRPSCLARATNGTLFIGDLGDKQFAPLRSSVWRLQNGESSRVLQPGTAVKVVAVALSADDSTLYVLDKTRDELDGRNVKLFTVDLNRPDEPKITTGLRIMEPIAMTVDTNGDVLILDRGALRDTADPPAPALMVVPADGGTSTSHPLVVEEPLCLTVDRSTGRLLVGGGGSSGSEAAGNIVEITRGSWTSKKLLPEVMKPASQIFGEGSPLVAPTAVVVGEAGTLYVLDAGLRPLRVRDEGHLRDVAEHAGVYTVVPQDDTYVITCLTRPGHLVVPVGMVGGGEELLVCDPGPLDVEDFLPTRALPFRFAVVTHFARGRLSQDEDLQRKQLAQTIGLIGRLVTEHKPAHTIADLFPSLDNLPVRIDTRQE